MEDQKQLPFLSSAPLQPMSGPIVAPRAAKTATRTKNVADFDPLSALLDAPASPPVVAAPPPPATFASTLPGETKSTVPSPQSSGLSFVTALPGLNFVSVQPTSPIGPAVDGPLGRAAAGVLPGSLPSTTEVPISDAGPDNSKFRAPVASMRLRDQRARGVSLKCS